MKLRHSAAALVLACAVTATVGYARQVTYSTPYNPGTPVIPGAVVYSESLTMADDAPLFIRPNNAGTELLPLAPSTLATGAGYRYLTSNFTVPNSGTYDLFSAQSFDGYLFLYSSPFNPEEPLTNVLAGDDDMSTLNGGAVPNRNGVSGTSDSGFRYDLNAGQNYTLVSSTWSATPTLNDGAIYNEIRTLPTPAVPADPIYSVADNGRDTEFVTIDYVVPSETTGTIASFSNLTLFNLSHTWVGDLVITLTHVESGRKVDILDRAGVDGVSTVGFDENLRGDYVFTDGGPELDITLATIPAGNYGLVPNSETGSSDGLSALSDFVGTNIAGTWRLTVSDWAAIDVGSLSAFSFTVTLDTATPSFVLGDFNFDGGVDASDIDPFVVAANEGDPFAAYIASFQEAFALLYPGQTLTAAIINQIGDFNGDGGVDASDIDPFVVFANNGGAGIAAIPEPAALGLLVPAGLLLSRRRR